MYVSDTDMLRYYWATYAASWAEPRRVDDEMAFSIISSGPILRINPRRRGFPPGGIVVQPDAEPATIYEAAQQYLAAWPDKSYRPELTLPPWEMEDGLWQRTLVRLGFEPGGWRPLIMGRLLDVPPPLMLPANVRIGPIDTLHDLQAARWIAEDAFFAQPPIQRFFLPSGLAGRITVYGAWAEGEVAATAAGYFMAGGCSVYSVATAPRYRRYGMATALVARILNDGLQAGLPVATLTCNPDRVGLYSRSGFHVIGRVSEVVLS